MLAEVILQFKKRKLSPPQKKTQKKTVYTYKLRNSGEYSKYQIIYESVGPIDIVSICHFQTMCVFQHIL